MSERPSENPLRAGESVLFIDHKQREYLRPLLEGKKIPLDAGTIAADELVGKPEGRKIRNTAGQIFTVLRPTFAQLIPNLPRKAQVIYPKDIAPILLWGDIYPGARVIEVGVGPGALTMALIRAVGPTGSVTSYDIREDHVAMARENVERFLGPCETWRTKVADAFLGFDEENVDRMTVDLPEPWHLVPGATKALRPGGVLLVYLPTVLQVKQIVDVLRDSGSFAMTEVFEVLHRPWHVEGLSIRPEHRMVAHTGFLITSRRLAPSD